jgi:competence protein ComEA
MTSSQPAHRPPAAERRRRGGLPERFGDAVAATAARLSVTPRAVVGLGVVVLLVLAVLAGRLVLVQQRSTPEPVLPLTSLASGPSPAPTGPPASSGVPVPPSSDGAAGATVPAGSPVTPSVVVVDVVGQVRRPGVVELPAGSRVNEAVAAAGGALRGADVAQVNMARLVVDGEQVVVPKPGQVLALPAGPAPGASAPGATPEPGAAVDLNTATLGELDTLPGVGPVLAQRILDWRAEHGRFASVDELGEVSGIGEAVLARVQPLVRV